MPKRNAQSKIEKYERKIRKLEEKEKRRQRIVSPINSSSESEGDGCQEPVVLSEDGLSPPAVPDIQQAAGAESTDNLSPVEVSTETGAHGEGTAGEVSDLDPELLSALGESTSDLPDYGENLHDSLSKLWLPLLKKGMSKENKDKLIKDYLIPDNCRLLQAPKLNAEISAAVPDMVRNRDKTLAASQQQLGSGITAINRGIDLLLKGDDKVLAMKHLSNGCRLLCDSHYINTESRKKLITPSLGKSFLRMISESERDESLFGSTLSENIKAAKVIEKQGLSIRKPAKPQKPTTSQSNTRSSTYQGNWSAPPRYPTNRGGRGGYNRRAPTTSGARRPYTAPPQQQQQQRAATQDKSRAPAQAHH